MMYVSLFLLKPFDELFQVKPAVGNDSENRDAGSNTLIGSGKEGKDIVPGGDVAGAVPEVDHILASC